MGDQLAGVQGPEWAVGAGEALWMDTYRRARAAFGEATKGSITPGKVADLVVLDAPPAGCGAGRDARDPGSTDAGRTALCGRRIAAPVPMLA